MISRRTLILRTLLLIAASTAGGMILLTASTFFLLDLGSQTQKTELIKMSWYATMISAGLTVLILLRMMPILRLLGLWEHQKSPDEAILYLVQSRAITLPNQLIMIMAGVIAAVLIIAIYVDTRFSGYQPEPVLINAALTAVVMLSIGFAVNIGLRWLFQPILRRILVPPSATLPRVSLQTQITLLIVLLGVIAFIFAGAFVYSFMIKGIDGIIWQERAFWLQTSIAPGIETLQVNQWNSYLERRLRPGVDLFILNRDGQYVERAPTLYAVRGDERTVISQAEAPLFFKRDYSTLRMIAIPTQNRLVLCAVYESQAGQSPSVQVMLSVLATTILFGMIILILVGWVISQDISRNIRFITGRLRSLTEEQIQEQGGDIAQTSIDEIGDLVQAFNRIQQQTHEYTTRLRQSVQEQSQAAEQRQRLLETMAGLTAPVIPLSQGLVVVLLSGYFDQARAALIQPNLLQGIAEARAQIAIIDLTAVAQASLPLAENLRRALRAVQLMGCQIILTGANAEVAWSLTQMDIGQETWITRRNLQDALELAFDRLNSNGATRVSELFQRER